MRKLSSLGNLALAKKQNRPALKNSNFTEVTSKGGVFNGGFETAPAFTAATTGDNVWVDGSASGSATNDVYGWGVNKSGTTEMSFDTAEKHSGSYSLKLSTKDVASFIEGHLYIPNLSVEKINHYLIPIKPSTAYRIKVWIKTNYVSGDASTGVRFGVSRFSATSTTAVGSTTTAGIKTTTDWTEYTLTFTSEATAAFIDLSPQCYGHNGAATLIMDAWFDDVTLEEVTTVAPTVAATLYPKLTAVTRTDSIDQSLDTGGSYSNTYAVPTSIVENATNIQTYTPTKKLTTQIGVWVVSKGTGNWTLTVHSATNVVLASATIANASLTDGAFNYFNVPNIWAAGALHFHVTSSVNDGTLKTNTSNDLEAASFVQRYAKRAETMKVNALELDAGNADGFLSDAVIDLDAGTYSYTDDVTTDKYRKDAYSYAGVAQAAAGGAVIAAGGTNGVTYKVNTGLPTVEATVAFTTSGDGTAEVGYSANGSDWTTDEATIEGQSTFYVRLLNTSASDTLSMDNVSLAFTLDTSSLTMPTLVPGSNSVYLSSNGDSDDATQDPSHQMKFQPVVRYPY